MNTLSSGDPLVALWQTTPKPDTHHLLRNLRHLNNLHRRLNRAVVAILSSVSLLLIFEETTGRTPTHGWLSVVWILALMFGAAWRRRARCNRQDAITLNTVSLLKVMIRRAKSDLLIARCLYAGVPCGALVGFLVMEFSGIRPSRHALAVPGQLHLIQTGIGIAVLITMIVTGAILSRSRRLQVNELSETLKLIEADL
jgi:hypothetical protein